LLTILRVAETAVLRDQQLFVRDREKKEADRDRRAVRPLHLQLRCGSGDAFAKEVEEFVLAALVEQLAYRSPDLNPREQPVCGRVASLNAAIANRDDRYPLIVGEEFCAEACE
jgi:hypothetical protein